MFIMTIFIIVACQDNLNLYPLDETEADFFDEEIDFLRATYGVYAKMSDIYWYNINFPLHALWLLPGDDLTSIRPYPYEVFRTLQPNDWRIRTYYTTAYQLINRANTLLEKIEKDEQSDYPVFSDASVRDEFKGEALCLRGIMNFQLWNYFGTSPNITFRISTRENIYPPNAEENELLDQAISDFKMSVDLLPASRNDAERGRITKSSALGYLGKALVFKANVTQDMNQYTEAISYFNKITDKSLVANYGDNFSATTENNAESLFEFQASQTFADQPWLSNDADADNGSFAAYYGYFNNHWSWWDQTPIIPTRKLIDAIDPGDPRLPYILDTATGLIRKYLVDDIPASSGMQSVNNPRLLRYADILLLQAEALNETGDQDGAVTLINQVRTRSRNMGYTGVPANLPTSNDQEQIRRWIQEERFVELAAEEGHRWLDLRRWEMAGWIDLESWDFSSASQSFLIQMPENLLFPIPDFEVDLNPNVLQNDGY